MSEQELYMMAEDRAKDELGAQNMMKKHQTLENNVEDYADVVRQLGERSRRLIEEEHPDWLGGRLVVMLLSLLGFFVFVFIGFFVNPVQEKSQ